MMFNLMIFFFTVEELTKKSSESEDFGNYKTHSFPVHLMLTFMNFSIYCYEVFYSIDDLKKYRMT